MHYVQEEINIHHMPRKDFCPHLRTRFDYFLGIKFSGYYQNRLRTLISAKPINNLTLD